ncbi:dihydroxyacetone kinase family protein (plasmid) [Coraliomargarita sp. W4R53]
MTHISNDSSDFVAQALAGFVAAYPDEVSPIDGGVVRANAAPRGHVAVVVGGGSGHYPAFAGMVGSGMASGAVCGNIFTSPSAGQAYRVAKAAERSGGVLFAYGNYAGDVLHFGAAQDKLRAEGIDARTVVCTDDIASAPVEDIDKRRGIAGDFVVFKIAGAAAERGDDMDEVERLAIKANHRTRTLGVAFGGCTFPGSEEPLFRVEDGMMAVGLGIHGEPGIRDVELAPSADIAEMLVAALLEDAPTDRGSRAAVVVNGLGTVKYEELFVLFGDVASRLDDAGVKIVEPEVGELVTSLDMAGASVTLLWLDDELEVLWRAPAYAPGYRKGAVVTQPGEDTHERESVELVEESTVAVSDWSLAAAQLATGYIEVVRQTLCEHESELGRLDAVAGDGDHGVGMRTGIDAAQRAFDPSRGLAPALSDAGEAWSENAGGTSGALWGSAVRALGYALDDQELPLEKRVVEGAKAMLDTVTARGGATVGDKTMVDAMVPFVRVLGELIGRGASVASALQAASLEAEKAAVATAVLRPALGRARPLAEKSLGHPDPGATSFAMIARAVAAHTEGPQNE